LNERSFILQLPTKSSIGFLDWQVVDAGEAKFHVAKFIEFPILVAVGAKPLAGVAAIFMIFLSIDFRVQRCAFSTAQRLPPLQRQSSAA